MQIVDLTQGTASGAWEDFDFCEATLLFVRRNTFPRQLAFRVWGATIVSTGRYVAGYGTLRLTDEVGGSIELYPYGETGRDFLRGQSGAPLVASYSWGIPGTDAGGAAEYRFDSVLARPFSYVSLLVRAAGPVTFEYNEADAIAARAYARDPGRFGWSGRWALPPRPRMPRG